MRYNNDQGILDLGVGPGLGLDLEFGRRQWKDIKPFMAFNWSWLEGDEYTDNLNRRTGVPGGTDVEFLELAAGVRATLIEIQCGRLGLEAAYLRQQMDMDTGWFIATPAKMKSQDDYRLALLADGKLNQRLGWFAQVHGVGEVGLLLGLRLR